MSTEGWNLLYEQSAWRTAPRNFYADGSNPNNLPSLDLPARQTSFNNPLSCASGYLNDHCQNFGECEFAPLLQGGQNVVSVCYGLPGLPARGTYVDMGIPGFESEENEVGESRKVAGRSRVRLSPYQTSELLRIFGRTPYISVEARKELAKALHLTEKQVRLWFQNRRRLSRRNRRKEGSLADGEQRDLNERPAFPVTRQEGQVDSYDKHSFDDCSPFSIDYNHESDEDLLSVIMSKIL